MNSEWLYRPGPKAEGVHDIGYLTRYNVLEKVKFDYEAAAIQMNIDGWTCDGHEPGAWCVDCKRLQMASVRRMYAAGMGDTK